MTHQIVYNIGGERTEGATDFLWMVLLAAGRIMHVPPHVAVGWVNAACLIGLAMIYGCALGLGLTWTTLCYLIIGIFLCPQIVAAVGGFSVLAFGFLLMLLLRAFVQDDSRGMAVAALFLCLLRPDGVIFAVPLLFAALTSRRGWKSTLRDCCFFFLLPGIAYFLWRFHYFHEFWPLPFLVKSSAERWKGLFVVESIEDILRYLCPALLLSIVICGKQILRGKDRDIVLCSVIIPSMFYCHMRLDQNYADRFFFYLILVPAYLLCIHHDRVKAKARKFQVGLPILWLLAWAWPYFFAMMHLTFDRYMTNSLVAHDIRTAGISGTMATTEAGRLPYDTQWRAIDLWGLNSPFFAKHLLQPNDVTNIDADLIVVRFSRCTINPTWLAPSSERTWSNMAENALRGFSADRRYIEFTLPYNQSHFASQVEKFTDGHQTYLCYFLNQNYRNSRTISQILQTYQGSRLPASSQTQP